MKNMMLMLLSLFCFCANAEDPAEKIFKKYAAALYQIRIIDNASGEKSSIGSGFQISSNGLIATNYHVISSFARHPKKYRIEYRDHLGEFGELALESVDVINDLALVSRTTDHEMDFFEISAHIPRKGEALFSLGNPHDLGMIVVPGTYNGLKKQSFYDRIHFTGSVNSGMSGGPVVNQQAKVVGINVATSGNQIAFLVPHDKLKTLYQNYLSMPPASINEQITAQLTNNQQQLIKTLLAAPWQNRPLGEGITQTIDVPFLRCWGESNADKNDALILTAVANCSLNDNIYLSSNLHTGTFEMEFRYMQAKAITNSKFYHLFSQQLQHARAGNKAGKEDITQYQCRNDIVTSNSHNFINKAVMCIRSYKNYSNLFDILYLSASLNKGNKAMVSHFTLSGVSQQSANAFTERFMESVAWK